MQPGAVPQSSDCSEKAQGSRADPKCICELLSSELEVGRYRFVYSAGMSIIHVMRMRGWGTERPLKGETLRGRENHLRSSKDSAGEFSLETHTKGSGTCQRLAQA